MLNVKFCFCKCQNVILAEAQQITLANRSSLLIYQNGPCSSSATHQEKVPDNSNAVLSSDNSFTYDAQH